jgi:transcriptional regulator with XRE-family HTH domain
MSERNQTLICLIGERLRQWREQRGLSRAELGSRLGIAEGEIATYEQRAERISVVQLLELSRALAVPVTYFFGGIPASILVVPELEQEPPIAEALDLMRAFLGIRNPEDRKLLIEVARQYASSREPASESMH